VTGARGRRAPGYTATPATGGASIRAASCRHRSALGSQSRRPRRPDRRGSVVRGQPG
jgi:hypothetical protein